ncbi:MAG: hypothetical protein PHT58_03725 [Eubacteriales bacterium]|nr:hypothetical protein [Eubacteriales bacterium]
MELLITLVACALVVLASCTCVAITALLFRLARPQAQGSRLLDAKELEQEATARKLESERQRQWTNLLNYTGANQTHENEA